MNKVVSEVDFQGQLKCGTSRPLRKSWAKLYYYSPSCRSKDVWLFLWNKKSDLKNKFNVMKVSEDWKLSKTTQK